MIPFLAQAVDVFLGVDSLPDLFAQSVEFQDTACWNKDCADYGRVEAGNLRKFGFTRKGRQRWQCTSCKKVVTETKGTVFHGKKYDEQTIIECFAMLAERNSLAAIHRIKGIKEETVSAWLLEAAPQIEQIKERAPYVERYVERTNLTSRHINGRLMRKTLSFSKELEMLKASSVWEDAVYNLTREVKTLRVEVEEQERRFEPRTPAMAAGLTNHIWTIKELLWCVVSPIQSTQDG
ncbi:MAG: IS1 family transposase [Acidobacteria bacterium]|nr:IS1 family transposase [Acidobacteriota bacterium]